MTDVLTIDTPHIPNISFLFNMEIGGMGGGGGAQVSRGGGLLELLLLF